MKASSSHAEASALPTRDQGSEAGLPANGSISSKFTEIGLDREVAVFSRAALETATPPERSST